MLQICEKDWLSELSWVKYWKSGRGLILSVIDPQIQRYTHWTSWHRQAGTSCDELKELGGWKTRSMVDRYAKFATEHLAKVANRIDYFGQDNVIELSHFSHSHQVKMA